MWVIPLTKNGNHSSASHRKRIVNYFYDGINSWAAYIDPDHVKCVLGHADIGLIPAWAKEAVGEIRRWFGLIADGVIIRGTFILHNDKTIEDELNDREVQIRGDFQIQEGWDHGKMGRSHQVREGSF